MHTSYLLLKTAHSLYGKGPATLAPDERAKVERLAARQYDLESRVLSTDEARDVVVPEAVLQAALREISSRYAGEQAFIDDLAVHNLTLQQFTAAVERELRVEAVLDKVGSRAAEVSDIDVELYYHYHLDQFLRPETRVARHILVTVNPEIPENARTTAEGRINAIAVRLMKDPRRFEEQALKHSECPTALNGGLLGEVRRGQLYAELDAVLFALQPMQLSGVVESPLGFHLLRCDRIRPAGKLRLDEVREQIRTLLDGRRRRICQNAWLKRSLAS